MTQVRPVDRPRVSFVLPSYNEEANIDRALAHTLQAARKMCSEFEIVVVDDGSTDRTADLVRGAGVREPAIKLLHHCTNRGYGEALRSGFAAAQYDYVFFTDADNQFDLNEIELLLAWTDRADVVAGYRKVRRDPFMRRLNGWGWNRIVRWLFYVPVRDIDCAFKLFRRDVLEQIEIESRGAMINTEIMVKLARNGCTIVEVGVTHFPRTSGVPQGAKLRVIARAMREVKRMYPHLNTLSPTPPATSRESGHNGSSSTRLPAPELTTSQKRRGPRTKERSAKPRLVQAKGRANGSNGSRRREPVMTSRFEEIGTVALRAQGDEISEAGTQG